MYSTSRTQSLLTHSINSDESSLLRVNTEYQYTSDDIWMAIKAYLFENNYFFQKKSRHEDCRYLLSNKNNTHYVLITPAVDVSDAKSTGVDYFLNKERQVASDIGEDTRCDVFDELMPCLLDKRSADAVILFPYHTVGHWLTGEISIHKKGDHYTIKIMAHDPLGGGRFRKESFLEKSIAKRIQDFYTDKEITFEITYTDSPFIMKRQQDGNSCGVIVANEIIKRIDGKSLSHDNGYDNGCHDLRLKHYHSMNTYYENSTDNLFEHEKKFEHLLLSASFDNSLVITALPSSEYKKYSLDELITEISTLNINIERFTKIPTREARLQHLKYAKLNAELTYVSFLHQHNLDYTETLHKIDKAYALLVEHMENDNDFDEYSPHSMGLREYFSRTTYKKPNERETIIKTGDKTKGVEPGFEAIAMEDFVFLLADTYPERKKRIAHFLKHGADVTALVKAHDKDINKYMIKQDYQMESPGKVVPIKENLKNSTLISNSYKITRWNTVNDVFGDFSVSVYKWYKTGKPFEKNCAAVMEALANDIARTSGMPVQEQTLYPSCYEDGTPKIMLKSKWLKNAKPLGPLSGGLDNTYYNYRVKPTFWHPDKIQFLANDSIPDLGMHYASILVQGDYDAIGKNGDNKLDVNGQLYGIDFGHSYRKPNKLIIEMLPNLHFSAHTVRRYPNISVFFNIKRSELIKGFLIYALLSGRTIPESLLTQYDKSFQEKIKSLEPGSLNKLFNDYSRDFNERANNEPMYANEYRRIVEQIKATQSIVNDAIEKLLKKIGNRIYFGPKVHDFLENIEKIAMGPEGTTLRSPDNQTLLNHIRLTEQFREEWKITYTKDEPYIFSNTFTSEKDAKEALKRIKEFAPTLSISQESKTIKINCFIHELDTLSTLTDEERIKEKFHQTDYDYYQLLKEEEKLNDFVNQVSEKLIYSQLVLTCSDNNSEHIEYALSLKEKSLEDTIPEETLILFNRIFEVEKDSQILFNQDKIPDVMIKLEKFNNTVEEKIQETNAAGDDNNVNTNRYSKDSSSSGSSSDRSSIENSHENKASEVGTRKKLIILAIKENALINLKALFADGSVPVNSFLDVDNNTALHIAVKENKPLIVEYLLKEKKQMP
ncbi:MAG: hypothetical protein LEGION0398_MBIBDBAK_00217 [Legionellaceae bacterium]